MSTEKSFIALNRFGYGADFSSLSGISQDPLVFLKSQLQTLIIPKHLSDVGGVAKFSEFLTAGRQKKTNEEKEHIKSLLKKDYTDFVFALNKERLISSQPFIERLTTFWANHFTISISKLSTISLVRDYQYRAIRPHITGKFSDMLVAVSQHPAMLYYLDNINSFGTNSKIGKRSSRGFNENLAREILELHTLGVNGGYTQKDVIELTKIITGWAIKRNSGKSIEAVFKFTPQAHEPGSKKLLGRTFHENGVQEGIDALNMLANHPSTAKHLATKMVNHFISDNPPESLVKKLEVAFLNSSGDLGVMTQTLIDSPESWEKPLLKIKPTPDFVISAFRATGYKPTKAEILNSFSKLDYKEFDAPSPQGYSDQNIVWAAPGAIMKRIEWTQEYARKLIINTNPYELAQNIFGSVMQEKTSFGIRGAESTTQGLVLLLMSPEFQRR